MLQSASAVFTPTFQATIPDILSEEEDYTRALSLSRLAYDLESVVSPMLAAALLSVISFHMLFAGLEFCRSCSQCHGYRQYGGIGTSPFSADAERYCMGIGSVRWGSMIAALLLPRLLRDIPDRTAMLHGTSILVIGMLLGAWLSSYSLLLSLWMLLGIRYSLAQTPSGRLLRRSAKAENRPSLFAAQFALSHACWLVTYPIAGWLGTKMGLPLTFALLGVFAAVALFVASKVWPKEDPNMLEHTHDYLPASHVHLHNGETRHRYEYMIDEYHPRWPS